MELPEENALENRKIQINVNGIARFIPALHSEWTIVSREWISYNQPPKVSELSLPGFKDNWLTRSDLIIDDLKALLSFPYHVFWSQMKYDRDLHKNLGRLLKRLPRPHDRSAIYPDEDVQSKCAEILRLSFFVFLRMSTRKESTANFMSAKFFSDLIYNDFLFDIARVLDICAIYYEGNQRLLKKMIEHLFTVQPKYLNDLKSCSQTIVESVNNATTMLENYLQSRQSLNSNEFEDVTLYATGLFI